MTQEEKRIKLAEAGGWTKFYESWTGQKKACIPNDSQILPLPDYFNDLNAVHELEKTIERLCKEGDYWFHLRELCAFPDAESDWNKVYFFTAVHATAAQRCEAIGKTLNLW
jgi:hypothetical protein